MKADWKTVPLGEVCEVLSGFAFKSSDYKNSGHFLIRISNVQDGYLSLSSPKYVQLDDVTARFALNAGDILVSLTGNVGRVAEVTHQALPAALNQRVAKVNPNEKILSKLFLLHFLRLNDFRTMLESQAHGAAQANVSPNVLKMCEIPLPPLKEQKRIVGFLDGAFGKLEGVRGDVEANLENVKELFQSVLSDSLSGAGEKGWEVKPLGDVCDIIGGGTPSKKQAVYYGGSIPWATVRDMCTNPLSSTEFTITEEGLHNSSSKVIPTGEVIIATRVGLGKVCLLEQDTAINQDLRGLIPKSGIHVDRSYLFYWYQSVSDKVIDAGTGATVQGVKLPFVKSLKIPLPPLKEQKRIVEKLDGVREQIDGLVREYEAQLVNLDDLRQSLLQKAFAGELI